MYGSLSSRVKRSYKKARKIESPADNGNSWGRRMGGGTIRLFTKFDGIERGTDDLPLKVNRKANLQKKNLGTYKEGERGRERGVE